ncbi:MAG: hypothetical protein ACI823_000289 [Chitinophagales bacterium]|jgi:hypothetical protein
MLEKDHIPVLTDLIEKGIETKSPEPELNHSEDLILEADDDREEPHIDVYQLEFEPEAEPAPARSVLTDDPALEQTIHRILNEHMELSLTEIKLAISQAREDEDVPKDY